MGKAPVLAPMPRAVIQAPTKETRAAIHAMKKAHAFAKSTPRMSAKMVSGSSSKTVRHLLPVKLPPVPVSKKSVTEVTAAVLMAKQFSFVSQTRPAGMTLSLAATIRHVLKTPASVPNATLESCSWSTALPLWAIRGPMCETVSTASYKRTLRFDLGSPCFRPMLTQRMVSLARSVAA